jgi:hypothetical protein
LRTRLHFLVNDPLQVLEVGVVAADADSDIVVDFGDSLALAESGHGAVGAEGVGADDHSALKLESQHGGAGGDGLPEKKWAKLLQISSCKEEK